MKRVLLYTVAVAALAACSKSAPPAPVQAPTPPAPAPTTPAPTPAPAPPQTASAPSPAAPQAAAPTARPQAPVANGQAASPAPASAPPASAHPLENDLRELEIAVRLRDAFEPKPEGTKFEFKVTMADGSKPIDETFDLLPTEGVVCERLSAEMRPGFHIKTYKLNPADHDRMDAASNMLQKLKAESTGGNDLAFQAIVETQVKPGAEVPDAFSLTIYARSHKNVAFVPLSDEKIIRATDPDAGQLFT